LKEWNKKKVALVRRYSGGGAVYHDLGNTNFTFLSSRPSYSKEINFQILTEALNDLGIPAKLSGRNDVIVNDLKVSGSAFKFGVDRVFHHGTLLIDVDMSQLARFLNPNKEKLKSKGVSSVQARVLNMKQLIPTLNHDIICNALINRFFKTHGVSPTPVELLSLERLSSIPTLKKCYEELKDWNWNFGETPDFEHKMERRFEWGIMDVNINSNSGLIKDIEIFSDSLYPDLISTLKNCLLGVQYNKDGISKGCDEAFKQLEGDPAQTLVNPFKDWITSMI